MPFRGFETKNFNFRVSLRAWLVAALLLLVFTVNAVDARVFKTTFDSITPDMPYPKGYISHRLSDTLNSPGTLVQENLNIDDYSLLAYRDNFSLAVTSLDADCDDTQSRWCALLCIMRYGQAQCHSYATAILRIDFSAYRPSVSGTYPIEISAYLRWEAEGDQADTNYNCGGY